MTQSTVGTTTPVTRPGLRGWIAGHPLLSFVLLAYGVSWLLWLPAVLGVGGMPLLVAGAFGPAVAAAVVTRCTGGSIRQWLRGAFRFRIPARYYLYALGLPAALAAVMNGMLAAMGYDVDPALALDRLPAYLSTLVFVAVLGGGQEEFGWRGFALPLLQRRWQPWQATLVLGLVWGVWHVPLYGLLGFILPLFLAFFYTYLYNATGSVLACVLLHASFTPALEQLILIPEEAANAGGAHGTADVVILGTVVLAAALLTLATRGRLGYRGHTG
ncbi:MAG TPA: type II CAAX endopeptidase family protein [Actinoplanes sp.]|nr:type II CAAX endopeptidase family protein [Actinoplanes sp.]